jgi:hypothetical protein
MAGRPAEIPLVLLLDLALEPPDQADAAEVDRRWI